MNVVCYKQSLHRTQAIQWNLGSKTTHGYSATIWHQCITRRSPVNGLFLGGGLEVGFHCIFMRGCGEIWLQNQLSTRQDRITDCKLDPAVHVGVCGCRCGELIWTLLAWAEQSQTVFGSEPLTQFHHG